MLKAFYLTLCLTGLGATARAQHLPGLEPATAARPELEFVQNRGQWPGAAQYRAAVPGGHLYLEPAGLRYVLLELPEHPGHRAATKTAAKPGATAAVVAPASRLRGHQLRVAFEGADPRGVLTAAQPTAGVRNYLYGDDPARWATGVQGFGQVQYRAPWPGVGARFYENAAHQLEYDFTLAPGADPGQVRLRYEGATHLTLDPAGRLHVGTTLGELTELAPRAYQPTPAGGRQPVACHYRLAEGGRVSFELGAYDRGRPLVIDPTVVFSTYTGARGDNWGFTAAYDQAGNLYSGGIVLDYRGFTTAYPTTPGAFQTTFSGVIDIALIKYNTTVSGPASRVWATYLGGSQADFPSSLEVNDQGELIVLGSTASSNFPTSRGAVQRQFGGGTPADPFGDATVDPIFAVTPGTDMVITRLNANGGSLVASTYLGGSGNDGIAAFVAGSGVRQLVQNYGDSFRGDVNTDAQGNVYVASVTASRNFPTTAGSFGTSFRGGTCDAVVVKLSPNLDQVLWSGYLGGTAADAAYSVQLDAQGNVVVAGGTLSPGLPATAGAWQPTAQGGVDGFAARIAANGSQVVRSTYLGTGAYDQAYFVQLGADGGVYILGQSLGPWPVSPGVYRNAGSRQYIAKLAPDLSALQLSTVFGSGRPTLDISPTAFLVDQCDRVYASGWGGLVNQAAANGPYVSDNGYTHGMPVTPNAVRTQPDDPAFGSDFYLAQFAPGLTGLSYATYYGNPDPNSQGDHVDGGTSRFDPRGVVYAAVCSCGSIGSFPVPPGAFTYSPTNGSNNCNNAAFKLNFEPTVASVGPSQTLCVNAAPLPLTAGQPAGGTWTGPGVSGSAATGFVFTPSPALVGTQTLTYTVPGATAACTATARLTITVNQPAVATAAALPSVCAGAAALPLTVGQPAGGSWSGPGVSGSAATGFVFTPTAALVGTQTLTYTLPPVAGCGPGSSTATTRITVLSTPTVALPADTTLCLGLTASVRLRASPAGGTWTGPGVSGSAATGFVFTPTAALVGAQALTYTVAATPTSCVATGQRTITVNQSATATAAPLPAVCANAGAVPLTGGAPAGGTWSGPGVSGSVGAGFVFTPSQALTGSQTLTYTLPLVAACGLRSATTTITVLGAAVVSLPPDTVLCPGSRASFRLRASPAGGTWSGPGLSQGNLFTPGAPGTSVLTYTVNAGTACPAVAQRRITLLAQPTLAPALVAGPCVPTAVAPLTVRYRQDPATVPADAVLTWNFGDDSTRVTGLDVSYTYRRAGTFRPRLTLSYNQGRCSQRLTLPAVVVEAPFFPNIFTPNGDPLNEFFAPKIGGCPPRLQVFSRWGRLVYENAAYQNNWNGEGLVAGLYYYLLTPPDGSPAVKGWVELLR